jgi:N6-L-threonylcarbamoyladenine synthase
LVGALLVGVNVAKAMAFAYGIPLLGVNHLEGHIFANQLDHPNLKPPLITLLISGGHTILIKVKDWGNYEIVGHTIDDAAGEAFDKVAKMLSLDYPGGPVIDHYAQNGDPDFGKFPRAMMKNDNFNFSFSGLKTAVLNFIESRKEDFVRNHVSDICASFQQAVSDVLVKKTIRAAKKFGINKITLAGGVARNEFLRHEFVKNAKANQLNIFFPSPDFCTDNAAMIGRAGLFHLKNGQRSTFSLDAVPNLKLESND